MKVNKWIQNKIPSLDNQIILITGGNSGIGFETAKIFALKGAHVILACRSIKRASTAKELILKEFPEAKITILIYDQSSFKSINHLVEEIKDKYDHIDTVIVNAGIYHPSPNQFTNDGLPLTMGVNYFGSYYLINKLLPYLEKYDKSKIVLVTSLTYRFSKYKDLSFLDENDKKVSKNYGLSKLCIIKYYFYLLKTTNVKVMMMHPGVTSTNIFSSSNNNFPRWFQKLAHLILPLFTHSPKKASLGMVLLAANNDFENGMYLGPRGLFGISGYPTKKKIPERFKKDVDNIIKKTDEIIKKVNN